MTGAVIIESIEVIIFPPVNRSSLSSTLHHHSNQCGKNQFGIWMCLEYRLLLLNCAIFTSYSAQITVQLLNNDFNPLSVCTEKEKIDCNKCLPEFNI